MTKRQILEEEGYEDLVFFENPDFDSAIVGVSHDNRVVYDYDLMIESCMASEGWTEEEAMDWIDYNTLGSLPYVENSPIILDRILDFELGEYSDEEEA